MRNPWNYVIVGMLAAIIYWQQFHSYGAIVRAEAHGLPPVEVETEQSLFQNLSIYGSERKHIFCSLPGSGVGPHLIEGYVYKNRISLLSAKSTIFQLEDPNDPRKPGMRHNFNGTCDISF